MMDMDLDFGVTLLTLNFVFFFTLLVTCFWLLVTRYSLLVTR